MVCIYDVPFCIYDVQTLYFFCAWWVAHSLCSDVTLMGFNVFLAMCPPILVVTTKTMTIPSRHASVQLCHLSYSTPIKSQGRTNPTIMVNWDDRSHFRCLLAHFCQDWWCIPCWSIKMLEWQSTNDNTTDGANTRVKNMKDFSWQLMLSLTILDLEDLHLGKDSTSSKLTNDCWAQRPTHWPDMARFGGTMTNVEADVLWDDSWLDLHWIQNSDLNVRSKIL